MADGKKRAGTIDMTPTWRSIMPMLIAAIENGTEAGRRLAKEELMDLAARVDAINKEERNEYHRD